MSKTGKRYTEEFKADAIRLVQEGRSISSVASDLGMNQQSLRNWLGTSKRKQEPEQSRIVELEAELKAAKRRNEELEESVYILKKATAIFVTSNRK